MEKLTVLIPVFNEENVIGETIESIRQHLVELTSAYEIICINDGSTDSTAAILDKTEDITVIHHNKNRGYGASLKNGLRAAQFSNILIIDADGTYPVSFLPEMLKIYRKNNLDMIIGSRTGANTTYPFVKKVPKFFIRKYANYITGKNTGDFNSGFRIFKKDVAMRFFDLYPDGFSFTTTITVSMLCKGYYVEYLPVDYFKRVGKSKIAPFTDTINFFRLLTRLAIFFRPMKLFMPVIIMLLAISGIFIVRDVFILKDLTQSTVLFPILTSLFFLMGLMADMIARKF
jgi:glycosyltransferase involved in cell wall biosynthesis